MNQDKKIMLQGFCIVFLIAIGLFFFLQPSSNIYEPFTNSPSTEISRDDFDCYVINMDKNKSRLQKFTDFYNKSDLSSKPYIRVSAVDGSTLNTKEYLTAKAYEGNQQIQLYGKRTSMDQLTNGMVGCYLSHFKVYDEILKSGKPYGLVFEDDAGFSETIYKDGILPIPKNYPNDWDMICLGVYLYDKSHKFQEYPKYKHIQRFWATHCYLISVSGIEKMKKYGYLPIEKQIDHQMSDLATRGQLNIYSPKDVLAWQTSEYSDVQMGLTA
jgi:GR25 family glycosyltransferase involved in LPS biosynthesis